MTIGDSDENQPIGISAFPGINFDPSRVGELKAAIEQASAANQAFMIQPSGIPCDWVPSSCVSRRDYFAACALQGLLSSGAFSTGDCVRNAVQEADLLIKELDK